MLILGIILFCIMAYFVVGIGVTVLSMVVYGEPYSEDEAFWSVFGTLGWPLLLAWMTLHLCVGGLIRLVRLRFIRPRVPIRGGRLGK